MSVYLLAIDQGTSSTRSIIFDQKANIVGQHQLPFQQYFPKDGWVEHDPEEIWKTVLDSIAGALTQSSLTIKDITAIGITNQRETTIIWDKKTGKAIYNAIVWQDRRTSNLCHQLKEKGLEQTIQLKTGLLLDPYFSATKIKWLLDNVEQAKNKAEKGELAFGTIDSFLLWRLTGGKVHATDATNASRTMLYNIYWREWDKELLKHFAIPKKILPEVLDNNSEFGVTDNEVLGAAIPITGMVGDQQAATIGQACFSPGMTKITYGTGAFLLSNTGTQEIQSKNRLLSTIAYAINGVTHYAMEGSIFTAGAGVQWLRDDMKFIKTSDESENFAKAVTSTEGVYFVPAFTGLGAPYWDPEARGALLGMTRGTKPQHIVRAMLEAVCYQTKDLLEAVKRDGAPETAIIRVDGGMVVNNWLMQFLADTIGVTVDRPEVKETTALGAAMLAGLGAGIYADLDEITAVWKSQQTFKAQMDKKKVNALYEGWQKAIKRVIG